MLLRQLVLDNRPPTAPADLYSSELLFTELLGHEFQRYFGGFANYFCQIEVLLFIRDPVDYACSKYQQAVKRDGYTGDIAMFFEHESMPSEVKRVIEFLNSIPKVVLTVFNYSACSDAVLQKTERWLGIVPGTLPLPPVSVINRSMTFPELEAQRMLNVELGPSGHLLSDFLCNELPLVRADDLRPSVERQSELWERLSPAISWVNDHIPETEHFSHRRDVREPTLRYEGTFTFSEAQFRLIMREFGRPHADARRILESYGDS
ncbi:hypothetical protein X769_15910 [Mesorhizobium sp. LSJC268A00]|nr:hypothetical protein X769_15910 [Mesorhizobium sp. LSJC268A00]ESZ10787.1 hypothetical protein X735_27830 [Mesorhizobium sp. L2C085B000]ESZ51759.1 hypothetical protein X731_06740 [Mesorhizobium sp. L2C054A000]